MPSNVFSSLCGWQDKKMQLKIAQWGSAVKTVFSRCTDVCQWRSNRPFCFCRPRALKCAVKHLFWPGKKTHVWKCTRAHTVNSWTGLFLPDIFWEWRLILTSSSSCFISLHSPLSAVYLAEFRKKLQHGDVQQDVRHLRKRNDQAS